MPAPKLITSALFSALIAMSALPVMAADKITIGAGARQGLYYPTGEALCGLFENGNKDVKCRVKASKGGAANLRDINRGKIEFGMVPSDWAGWAYDGRFKFKASGGDKSLRSVVSLFDMPLTFIVAGNSEIKQLSDLKGKKISIAGTTPEVFDEIRAAYGWKISDFPFIDIGRTRDRAGALCKGELDAILFQVAHPTGLVQKAVQTCKAKVLPLPSSIINRLTQSSKAFVKSSVPGGMYAGNGASAQTIATKVVILSRAAVAEDVVYAFVKSTIENTKALRRLHPAHDRMRERAMSRDGLVAPLHPGAARYYRERGWIR